MDAEHIPGIQRPADEKDTKALSTHLRRMCVAEAERIGVENLVDAFDATTPNDSRTIPERPTNRTTTKVSHERTAAVTRTIPPPRSRRGCASRARRDPTAVRSGTRRVDSLGRR